MAKRTQTMRKPIATCGHFRITIVGGEETALRSAKCGECGSMLSRRIADCRYVYAAAG